MKQVRLCEKGLLPGPGKLVGVAAGGQVWCVVGLAGGGWRALPDACPHRGAPLHEGSVEGGQLLCPWHAWAFDLENGEAAHDCTARVEVHGVRINGETAEIELSDG